MFATSDPAKMLLCQSSPKYVKRHPHTVWLSNAQAEPYLSPRNLGQILEFLRLVTEVQNGRTANSISAKQTPQHSSIANSGYP